MRKIVVLMLAASAVGLAAAAVSRNHTDATPDRNNAQHAVPVIVELFTSEGCSSCPPADDVLTKLVTTQPVPGAEIIALGEHVDYWDRLGWRDPFSSAQFSSRQSQYASGILHLGGMYTPQMIVDGRQEFVGSDYGTATAAIAKAVARNVPRRHVSLALAPSSDASIRVTLRVEPAIGGTPEGSPDVWFAITEDGLQSRVQRGENANRTLHHTAVVRTLTKLGAMAPANAAWSTTHSVPVAQGKTPRAIHLVAFVQEPSTRQILGAAILTPSP